MKRLLFFFCFFTYSLGAELNQDVEFINLSEGFQYVHPLPAELKNQKLKFEGTYKRWTFVKYKKADNALLFTPRKKGTGTLIIKNTKNKILKKISIDVKKINLHKIAKEVGDLLITIDGIEIKILNNRVIIDGEVLLPKEMDRIDLVVQEYTTKYVKSLVTLSPKAQIQLARLIEKKIGYLTPPDEVRVVAHNNRFILEGEVATEDARKRAYFIATLYTRFDAEKTTEQLAKRQIMMIKNNIVVRQKPKDKRKKIIQVIVHYVDLNKAYSQGFSFQWAPQIGDQTSVSTIGGGPAGFKVVPAITATINNFFPKLNWLKSFNFARVLHNANLTLQDGEEGVISVNKSVPYTSRGSDGQISVQQAQTEISTVIKPKIVGPTQDTIQMKVTVKVGSIGVTTSAGPSIDKRTIQTNIHVRDRLSAVLGGLITSDVAKGYNRLPPNSSQTPIVNLFSAKDYSTSKSQFVVFITPIIKASASAGVSRIKDKFKVDGGD